MKKVFVQIVDFKTDCYQFEMIQEPVKEGFEIANALGHFGIGINSIDWISDTCDTYYHFMFGIYKGTTKVVTVIVI